MLRILSINPTGFGPYGMHEDVSLDNCGVVWLAGVNGSGKSCFFNVIAYCLWGRVETVIGDSVAGADEVSNETLGASCPRVTFMVPMGTYRVTCSRRWKVKMKSPYPEDSDLWPFKGTDIYLERLDEETGTWRDCRKSTSAKTRDELRSILGVSYERYLVTTYLAQGKGLDFLRGKHADRMSIFTDVANLGMWDNAALMCKVKRGEAHLAESNASASFARLQGELNGISIMPEASVAAHKDELLKLHGGLEAKQLEKKQYDAEVVSIAQQMGSIQIGANPYVAQLRDHESKAHFAQQQAALGVQARETDLRQHDAAVYAALERAKARTSTDVYTAKSDLGVAEVAERKAKQAVEDFLSGKLTNCPTCGQELPNKVDGAHLQADLDNCVVERKSREALLKDAQDALEAKKAAEMRSVQEKGAQERMAFEVAVHEAKLAFDQVVLTCNKQREELEAQRAAYDQSEASKNKAIEDLNVKQQKALDSAYVLQRQLDADLRRITELETALQNNESAEARRAELVVQVAEAEKTYVGAKLDTAEWSWLTQNLGNKGFKAYKLGVICDRLNELLAEALADIDGSFRLWVKPYRVRPGCTKLEDELTADDVINEVTIYVQEGGKQSVPVYLYSGGEASIIALALLVALWQLADEYGSGTNLLLLDEVVGFLDSGNAQIVVRFLEGLKTAGKTVIAVSHSQVVDSVSFDARWEAVKENGVSRLVRS